MRRVQLLDLFCGAGGAAMGYDLAGFEVVGVDIEPQPRYPFRFVQGDALTFPLDGFDALHASPPCQAFTRLRGRYPDREYPDLISATRERLEASGKPFVIENVAQAPIRRDLVLCGGMFELRVYRHRAFESNVPLVAPFHPRHVVRADPGGQRKAHYLAGGFVTVTGHIGSFAGEAMGIGWMIGLELSQAIPPAYTRYIGDQLRCHV